jgi:KDO2-lipid IV(A) lauroyltransferase
MIDLLYFVDRPGKLSEIVDWEYEENLKKALEKGKGVIAVSAHLGNFPLMFVSLAQKGYKVNVVIRNMRDEKFSKFMYQLCSRWGINMIQTFPAKQFFRESLNVLRRNELLFILLDEVVSKENGVKVKFFDHDVIRATGPILFFKRTFSPILPMFIVQDEKKRFKILIEQPFKVVDEGDEQGDVLKNISGLTKIVERYVKQYPFQWGGWFNKRWAFGITAKGGG